MQTSTSHWVVSMVSEASPPLRSLGPIRTSQRSTKVPIFTRQTTPVVFGTVTKFLPRVSGGRSSQAIVDGALSALRSLVKERLSGGSSGSGYNKQVCIFYLKGFLR